MKRYVLGLVTITSLLCINPLKAQQTEPFEAAKKYSVIIDNDFCGDPDGLCQLQPLLKMALIVITTTVAVFVYMIELIPA